MAYFLFLMVAARGHRGALLRYVAEGLLGRRREWRPDRVPEQLSASSRWRARLAGVPVFWRAWLAERNAVISE
jgi:hypothetical protein